MSFESHTRRTVLGVLMMFCAAGAAPAQEGTKIATIDSDRVVRDSMPGKAMIAELQKVGSEKEAELKVIEDELLALQRRFQEGELSLAEDNLAEIQAQAEEKKRTYDRMVEDAQRDFQKMQEEQVNKIRALMGPIISSLAQDFGYSLILENRQSGLVWVDPRIDITDLAIQRLNANANG